MKTVGFVLVVMIAMATAQAVEPVDALTGASGQLHPPLPPLARKIAVETMLDWLGTHWLLAVSTVSADGQPHTAPVCYVVDGTQIYFRSLRRTHKVRNLEANPKVAFTVWDSHTEFARIKAIQGIGTAAIVTDAEEIRRINERFNTAPGSVFARAQAANLNLEWLEVHRRKELQPDAALVRITPVMARWVDNERRPGGTDIVVF